MTTATKTLLAQLAAHIGNDGAKKKSLTAHVEASTKRKLHRSMLHNYLHGRVQPTMDNAIPIMRWMQMEGLIVPLPKQHGLFAYTATVKTPASGAKNSKQRG